MASYSVEFSANVRKDFRKISEADADRILRKIQDLAVTPRPPGSKKLKGEDLYRIRIGMYRVVYEIEDHRLVVFIVRVKHRRKLIGTEPLTLKFRSSGASNETIC